MPRLRSGLLAAWTTAWFDGAVGADDVLDAVAGRDAPHQVSGLPGTGSPDGGPDGDPLGSDVVRRRAGTTELRSLGAALIELRGRAAAARLVLPAPGDVRGLPAPGRDGLGRSDGLDGGSAAAACRAAALAAGEAVVCGELALVPSITRFGPSSAPTQVRWDVFEVPAESSAYGDSVHAGSVDAVPVDVVSVADAGHELAVAMRETADALQAAALDAARADPGAGLARARRAGERLDLPPGFPSRAVSLLAQAERLHAALQLALSDPLGGAVDRVGIDRRHAALAPLVTAVRRARVAGYNAGAEQRQRGAA